MDLKKKSTHRVSFQVNKSAQVFHYYIQYLCFLCFGFPNVSNHLSIKEMSDSFFTAFCQNSPDSVSKFHSPDHILRRNPSLFPLSVWKNSIFQSKWKRIGIRSGKNNCLKSRKVLFLLYYWFLTVGLCQMLRHNFLLNMKVLLFTFQFCQEVLFLTCFWMEIKKFIF